MSRPISAQDLNKLAGRRLSRTEREDMRNRIDARWESKSNRTDQPVSNPYAAILEQLTAPGASVRPKDLARIERMEKLSEQREADLAGVREREQTRQINALDPAIEKAQAHFVDVTSLAAADPEDVRDRGACLQALDDALDGKEGALPRFYKATGRIVARTQERLNEPLAESRTATSDATLNQCDLEKQSAHLDGLEARANLNQVPPPTPPTE